MQPSSLSTYIGYITGPRAEQPVGVRVVEPPKGTRQHQRGSLYSVIEVSGDHPDRAAIVDRLLSEVQRVYYSAKGSQSQVMVEAVQQTQQLLREINAHTPHHPLQLGIMCAALLGGKLLVASSGAAFALVRVSDRVHMFPSDPSTTVGGYGSAPVEIYRQDVQADDALFLGGGGWLNRVNTRTLASIVAFTNADNCAEAADELFDQAGQMAVPGLLIVLGANQEPPRSGGYGSGGGYGGGYSSGPSSSGPSGGMPPRSASRRPRFGGLPTALSTSPPARLPPSTPLPSFTSAATPTSPPAVSPPSSPPANPPPSAPHAAVDEPSLKTPSQQTRSIDTASREVPNSDPADEIAARTAAAVEPASHEFTMSLPETTGIESTGTATTGGSDLPVEPGEEFDPIFPPSTPLEHQEHAPTGPSRLTRWQERANLHMGQIRHFLGRMLPDRSREAETRTAWEDLPSEEVAAQQNLVPPRYNELEAKLESAPVREPPPRRDRATPPEPMLDEGMDDAAEKSATPSVMPVLEMSPFAPPPPTRGARARLFLLIALVIVVLVPAVVAAVNFGQGNSRRAEAEKLTAQAEILLLGAQSALDQGDKVTARERLTEAQDLLAEAIELDGSNENRTQLIATIELELQEVLQVMPLYGLTEPLITFPADARPQHVLVINEDIFIIDAGRQALVQYRFDPATETVADQQGQLLLSQGDVVDGAAVGALADLAWLPLLPGFEDRPSLLITDRNNNIFRYEPRVEGASLMQVADRGSWGSIGQVQTFSGRVYIADEAKGSILRYNPGSFEAAGESWFSPETPPVNLERLIAMEIDGDIWLLMNNGMILRYRERQQLPFSPENSIGLAEEPVDMYVTRQDSAFIYVVDAGQDRILVYEKSGAYVGQLRAPENDLLRGLSSLFIDEVGGVMYILTQTGLYSHPVLP